MTIDFNKYQQFVDGVTSTPSQDFDAYIYRLQELNGEGCKIADLQTAADGLCAEGGEFMEIVRRWSSKANHITAITSGI